MQQYTVKPNDTLYSIAQEFNVPLAQLIKANPQITNPNLIHEGQTIIIPNLPPIPDQIDIIESNAVKIIDDIIMSEWQSANSRVNEIRSAMNELIPLLQEVQVTNNVISGLNAAIRNLEQNIQQRRTFPAISQANRVTQIIADVLDFYNVISPPDVNRLAYFARQVIVNVEENDWAEAYQNYRRALTVWQRLSAQLEENYAEDVKAFVQILNDLRAAIDRRDYQAAINGANRILEYINVLNADFEQLYT